MSLHKYECVHYSYYTYVPVCMCINVQCLIVYVLASVSVCICVWYIVYVLKPGFDYRITGNIDVHLLAMQPKYNYWQF